MKLHWLPMAALAIILVGCAPAQPAGDPPARTQNETIAATSKYSSASESPKPTISLDTSGSIGRDFSNLGLNPDDMADFINYMKGRICDQDEIGTGISTRRIGGLTVAEGGGPESVELTAYYYCPSKLPEVRKELDWVKANGS